MASQNPSHKSSTPNPLDSPRTNPLEITRRKSGEVNSRGLSVHFGVHGKIRRSTPKVAHKVTSNNARTRQSQRWNVCFFGICRCSTEPAEKCSPETVDCSSGAARGELCWVRRSLRAPGMRHIASRRSIDAHRVILRPQGLDPLTHVAVINVAAVNFQEIAQGRRIIPRALK